MQFQDKDTISTCLMKIAQEMGKSTNETPNGLQSCLVAAGSSHRFQNVYHYLHEVYLILRNKDDAAGMAVHAIVALLLSKYWASADEEQEMIKAMLLQPLLTRPVWRVTLPSIATDTTSPRTPSQRVKLPLDLKKSNWNNCFYLQWEWLADVANIPRLSRATGPPGDLSIYVWQPYKERPVFDCFRLVVLHESNGRRKIVAVTSSPKLLERLKRDNILPGPVTSWQGDSTIQMGHLFERLYWTLRNDAVKYIDQMSDLIEDVVRQNMTPILKTTSTNVDAADNDGADQPIRAQNSAATTFSRVSISVRCQMWHKSSNT